MLTTKPPSLPERIEIKLADQEASWVGKLKVFIVHDFSSCGFYRCFLPMMYVKQMRLADVRSSYEDKREQDSNPELTPQFRRSKLMRQREERRLRENIAWADVVVMQRQGTQEGLAVMDLIKSMGKPVVHESDDMCEAVPRTNPAYWYWQNKDILRHHGDAFRKADLVTTTNPRLAAFYEKEYACKAAVLENQVDWGSSRWAVPFTKGPGVCVGWMGSESHIVDLDVLKPVVEWLLASKPEARFEFCGFMPDWANGLPRTTKVEGQIDEVPRMMSAWDIGLCPISDIPFNTVGKSDIKFLEYSAARIATIAADLEPYRGSLQHGANSLLVKWDDPDAWIKALDKLIGSPLKRRTIVENAGAWTMKNRSMAFNAHRWFRVYVALLTGRDPKSVAAPDNFRRV